MKTPKPKVKDTDLHFLLGEVSVPISRVFQAISKSGGKENPGGSSGRSVMFLATTHGTGTTPDGKPLSYSMTGADVVIEFGDGSEPDHWQRRYIISVRALVSAAWALDQRRAAAGYNDAPATVDP